MINGGYVSSNPVQVSGTTRPVTTYNTTPVATRRPVSLVTTATSTYGMSGDPERRLNESSARQLAKMVFMKYDDNDSGYMNSEEAANMITDLYASINMEYRATPADGKEFMQANDSDRNWQ